MLLPFFLRSYLRHFDWLSFLCVIFLLPFGLLVIFSADIDLSKQQFVFALLGLFAYGFFAVVDYRFWRKAAPFLFVLANLLLAVTFVWGRVTRSTLRWLSWGPFNFQPAELAKLVLILSLAWFLTIKSEKISSFKRLALSLLLVAPAAALVFLQPAFGSSLLLLAIWFGMAVVSPIRPFHLISLLLIGAALLPGGWFLLKDYQHQRILSFLNPQGDPLGSGYNVIQSMIAIGSGQIFGRGFGRGTQSQLRFLPERHTDFVFASLAEEWGLIGSLILLLLFFTLLWRLTVVFREARDDFGALICFGVFVLFLAQVVINVGMNLGVLPVTGLPLPLISYGGSSLVVSLSLLGLVQSVAIRRGESGSYEED